LLVEASGSFILTKLAPNKAVATLDLPVVLPRAKQVNKHPNPTGLVDNPTYGEKLGVTLDGTIGLDFDGIPYANANGTSKVSISIQKLNKINQPVPGAETIRIMTHSAAPISADSVKLTDGKGSITCGPTNVKGETALEFVDPDKALNTVNIKFRWR